MLQSNGANGVLFGQWQAGGRMQLKYLDPSVQVNVGDVVVTNGRTLHVPKGLVVGKVSAIHRNVQSDELNVDVAPLIDFNSLQIGDGYYRRCGRNHDHDQAIRHAAGVRCRGRQA